MEHFFKDHASAFNTPDKKAVFLTGVLTKFLLDVQYANRKATPFREKLYGLKFDERRIKKRFPEIIEKLKEYRVYAYTWLEELCSEYLIKTEESGWNLSKDEISYYFALGLNLGGVFKEKGGKEVE